jgi:hypothetical protein
VLCRRYISNLNHCCDPVSYVVCCEMTSFLTICSLFSVMLEWYIVSGDLDCQMNDDTVTYGICVFGTCTSAREGFVLNVSVCTYNN